MGTKTRQFIIEKAAPIINQKGMAGTAISDIMEATQLHKGGIYGNFQSKEEICMEVFNFLSTGLETAINTAMQEEQTPQGRLFALLDYYRDTLALSPVGGCPLMNFGIEADDTSPAIRQRVAESIISVQDRIAQLVTEGKDTGQFQSWVSADAFAVKVFTLLEGAILTSRVLGGNTQMILITDMLKTEIQGFAN